MGEIAEMIMMGFMCQQCGMPIDGDGWGYPRCCDDCKDQYETPKQIEKNKER
jgi:hypothetical protein